MSPKYTNMIKNIKNRDCNPNVAEVAELLKVLPKKELIVAFDTETSKTDEVDRYTELGEAIYKNIIVTYQMSIYYRDTEVASWLFRHPAEMWGCLNAIAWGTKEFPMAIYVHNLGYDWHFCKRELEEYGWSMGKSLFMDAHKPLFVSYWREGAYIQFKDSLAMFNTKLAKVCEQYQPAHGKTRDWDYNVKRTPETALTTEEIQYAMNDTKCLCECIWKYFLTLKETYPGVFGRCTLAELPRTATGLPRALTVSVMDNDPQSRGRYLALQPETVAEMEYMKLAYRGGFTHANPNAINAIWKDVTAWDFSSSYPARIVMCKFPMSAPFSLPDIKGVDQYLELRKRYPNVGFYGTVEIVNPVSKMDKNHMMCILSEDANKNNNTGEGDRDNGRILSMDGTHTAVYTNVDIDMIVKTYNFDSLTIKYIRAFQMDYLPQSFRDLIINLYQDKTNLKHGDPVVYGLKKAILNSCYGMMVQDPLKMDIDYCETTGEYSMSAVDERSYKKMRKSNKVRLPYIWGVFITAYARQALFELGECAETWIYSDTDSIYCQNINMDKLNAYNNKIKAQMLAAGVPVIHNQADESDKKDYVLGVAELDGEYMMFKTLGAKKYCCIDKESHLKITVAGVPKKTGAACLKGDITNFQRGLVFDGATTGKLAVAYSEGDKPFIDLRPCDYTLELGLYGETEYNGGIEIAVMNRLNRILNIA